MGRDFKRIAIVNRGEPAVRLIHAVREHNRETGETLRAIALHTLAERRALFVREADEAVCLDEHRLDPSATGSLYLDHGVLRRALRAARADAAWPGWGFVAEDAGFAAACEADGITFIGPPADVMRRLGDKIASKLLAEQAGLPVAPWSGGPLVSLADAEAQAAAIGFPVVIKATAGGGGRGIRVVTSAADLPAAYESASAEALKSFGDATLFMERRLTEARHVEVQVVADDHGAAWAVGVRDCSVQRRNQKVIEESRSTALTGEQEHELRAAAERLCVLAGYRNAGTVEFLYQPREKLFAFLEVNTRLQVEHPVTELTTGVDLVKLQLHVARGGRLEGRPPPSFGHAIEARLNAEDPEREFAPAPGAVELLALPTGPGVRVDTGIAEGDVISPEFDSMIAKVIAWGRDREEARARLQRSLDDMAVVVRGGMTNKSFLLHVLGRPEFVDATHDTGWLDRLSSTAVRGWATDAPAAIIAAAIDAHDDAAAVELERFRTSAARGRPQVSREIGQAVDLQHGGQSYRVRVGRAGRKDWYRVVVDGVVLDVTMERLARFRSRLIVGGRSHRVVSFSHGPDHIVDVDGSTHRISRDDGGVVRAPAAAVVVSVAVAPGDVVKAGDRLVVVESMKMEVAIAAPIGGTVREVHVSTNAQVEPGAPLVTVDAVAAGEGPAETTELRARFDELTASAPADAREQCRQLLEAISSFIAGYDLTVDDAAAILDRYEAARRQLPDDDPELVTAELDVLTTFADISMLTRNRPAGDVDNADAARSPREHFRTYLRSLDLEAEGLPDRFRQSLLRALAHYGIDDLERTAELSDALYRIFQAQQRGQAHVPVIARLLHRIAEPVGGAVASPSPSPSPELRETLDRLIVATQLRHPVLGSLARTVRYRRFDQPLIEQSRSASAAVVEHHLARLGEGPDPTERASRMDELVNSPHPLLERMADRLDDPTARPAVLEVLTRRYYKIRPLGDLTFQEVDGELVLASEYHHRDRHIRVLAGAGTLTGLPRLASAIATVAGDGAPGAGTVVVDLYVTAADSANDDARSASVRSALEHVPLFDSVQRVAVSVCVDRRAGGGVQHFTFRRVDGGRLAEDAVVRGLHPMIARRLHLWRLANFEVARLPSAQDVYLFDCVARENRSDERLIALAEVRDLTPVRDRTGQVTELPELEQVLGACLDSLRLALADRPDGGRLAANRVQLYVWPTLTSPLDEMLAVAGRLAPTTEHLGIDQVVVQCRIPDGPAGEARDVVVRVGSQPGTGLTVRVGPPPTEPLRPLDEYSQKVTQAQRRGAPYPYELVTLLAGSGGSFTEHDLDDTGRLVPVDRPPGGNRAGVVVGVVRTPSARYPEGMTRVAVLGDPTKALGALAEAECRRVLAALDLAAAMRVPVEWFALSAGAKIAMNSGSENLDWVGRVLRRIVELTQAGTEINVVVTGINVGAQPYWNAEATMLMHTRGILVMTPDSAMVLTGKHALDYAGGVSAEDNLGLGGYERIMGPNGEAQYWAPDVATACEVLFAHYEHAYVAPGERFPRRAVTTDPVERDVRAERHHVDGIGFSTVGDIFSATANRDRKKPFDIRTLMRATIDHDHPPLERWAGMHDAETAVVFDAHLGGYPVTMIGVESRPVPRYGAIPADGPDQWSAGTLFPLSSKKLARALNASSGNRPAVILANLSGFDGSPESLRKLQLEYGAEIGRAVVNFDGPLVLCVVSRYHGGAFVVFSATLNDQMEVLAVEGSFASVIGGSAAAAVVFGGDVAARTHADPRVRALEAEIARAPEEHRGALRTTLAETVETVRLEKLGEVASEFDTIHSVERALQVGSVHRIIPAAELRPALVAAVERGIQRAAAG